MQFLTSPIQKETLEISELLDPQLLGKEVCVTGAVHTIRDMGTVAFVILRKAEGLLQCVYEEACAEFSAEGAEGSGYGEGLRSPCRV